MLCPDLVGRDAEVDRLARRVDGLTRGEGGVLAVVGDAGSGKSRLLHAARGQAAAAGCAVLSGRAVPSTSPSAYRPLREAFLAAFRAAPLPDDPSLAGFEGHLGQLVPTASAPAVEESPVLLAEAVVRLLAVLAGVRAAACCSSRTSTGPIPRPSPSSTTSPTPSRGVESSAWSRRAPAALPVTSWPALERRDPGAVLVVEPLGDAQVVAMVGACLGTADPPAHVADFVVEHSDGNPFLVEELLAGLVADGQLRHAGGAWDVAGPLTPAVPASLRDSIDRRLAALDPTQRSVLGAAALLGRHFDWELLPGIAEVDGRAAADALRAAVAEQLIEAHGDGFVFRHALTREAVLASLLPPERRALAPAGVAGRRAAHPGLPGPSCELAADLAEAAGDRAAAAARLVESARRALVDGALATAEATARRARSLADVAGGGSEPVGLDADEVLVQVLGGRGQAGRRPGARAGPRDQDVGERRRRRAAQPTSSSRWPGRRWPLVDSTMPRPPSRTRGRWPAPRRTRRWWPGSTRSAARSRSTGRSSTTPERVSRRAVEGARATGQPAVLCEALLVLGRVLRPVDVAAARSAFREAAAVAEAAGLARWHLRAQQEVALEAWVDTGAAPLEETRALAARYGAHVTVAVMDLSLADIAIAAFDREGALRHATACAEASRRYGLATEAVAELWLAGAHVLTGDDVAMHAAIDASLAKGPDDPRILADLYGRVLATRALVRDELDSLRGILDTQMDFVRTAPATTSVYPGRIIWTLLRTADDDDLGAPARAELAEVAHRLGMPMFDECVQVAEAVAEGREGRPDAASARFVEANAALAGSALCVGLRHMVLVLVARPAIRDGWGEPARWLREAEAFFTDGGYDLVARRCRTMLAEAGAPVPRRRGTTEVPQGLRALGVTGREVDVLRLVVARKSNKEIAAELVLSPKTVERHLSSLFSRLGVRDRRALAEVGEAHLA